MRPFQAVGFLFLFLASDSIQQTSIRMPPTITKHPKEINYFRGEGDSITLDCQADGTPNITYKWERNGADLDLNLPRINVTTDGTIKIESATSLDEGYYQCFATNEYGTALSTVSCAHRAVLRFDSPGTGTASVNNVTVKEGEPFHIQIATVKSFPKPTYVWEEASGTSLPVTLSKRVQIADNGDLYFAYAKTEDGLVEKSYKCTAYNPYLDVKTGGCYTRVIVTRVHGGGANFIPSLGFSSAAQIVGIVGESVTLRCFFNAKPEPAILWKGPGNTLPRDRHKIEKEGTDLIISNITASDEGNYTCIATNSAGDASHTFRLIVEKKPSFITTGDRPHNVNASEGDTVTFNCNADAKPEADVVWLRNGKQISDKDVPPRYVISKDKKSLTINHICLKCPDRDTGTDIVVIQCNASNIHGYTFASGYLNVFEKTRVEVEGKRHVTVDIDNGTVEVELKCSVKYDPTTPVTWTWYRQQLYGNTSKIERVEQSFYADISTNEGSLKITIDVSNATVAKLLLEAWRKHFGPYICVADNGVSQSNGTIDLQQFIPITTPPATTTENPNAKELHIPWTIIITIAATMVGSFLVFFLFNRCYHKYSRNKNIGNSDRRRPLTTEDSTMPQYETIPYDALPMAEIPDNVTASTQQRDTYKNVAKNYSTEANRMDVVNSINDPTYDDCINNAGYEEPMNDRPIPPKARSGEKPEELNVYTGLSDRENSYLNLYADL